MLELCTIFLAAMPAEVSPLRPQTLGNEAYVESFRVSGQMSDGTFVRVRLLLNNVGVGDARPECRVVIAAPGLPTWQRSQKSGAGEWSFSRDPYALLAAGNCYLRGGQAFEAHVDLDGVSATLILAAKPQRVRLRGNRVRVAGDRGPFYEQILLVPWAPARLAIRFPTGKHIVRHGFGHGDRRRWTVMPYDIAKRWLRVRALQEDRSLLLQARIPPGNGNASGWVWRQDGPAPEALTDLDLQAYQTTNGMRWKAAAKTADGTYQITLGDELDRHAPVEEMGIMGYALHSLLGNPTTHTFRAEIVRQEDHRRWTGIVEVHNENE